MMSLTFAFWMLVVLFAVIGGMRGWAKELLVTFSVVLAIFIITVLETYVPFVRDYLAQTGGSAGFWARSAIVTLLVFFGYQTPNLQRLAGARFARERLQDTLLGVFIGALNGYLIVGTMWFYLAEAGYPFGNILPPVPGTPAGDSALELISYLPPRWLGIPSVYFAVAIAFAFVVVVFI